MAINRARNGEGDPVKLVTDTIRRHTDGLDILLSVGRVDLTLEWLVVDESRPYQDPFGTRSVDFARARIEEFRDAGYRIPDRASLGAAPEPVTQVMTTDELRTHLGRLLESRLDGFPLPVLHDAQATLVQLDATHTVVRRDPGEPARIALRLIRLRVEHMASGRRFLVSELPFQSSDRFGSALGPLLAALPGVEFDSEAGRLHYQTDQL